MRALAVRSVVLVVFATISNCKLVQEDGKQKAFASEGGKVEVELVQGAQECLATESSPPNDKVKYTSKEGDEGFLLKDVSNCHFIATMTIDSDKKVRIYRTMEDIIALISEHFCGIKSTQVSGLCDAALAAIGNFADIIKTSSGTAVSARVDEVGPQTYIYSRLKAQLSEAAKDYSVEFANTNNTLLKLKQKQITTSVAEDYTNWYELNWLFLLGELGTEVDSGGRYEYLNTCFVLVTGFMKQVKPNLSIKNRYPLSRDGLSVRNNLPYVEEDSVLLVELNKYLRYGYSSTGYYEKKDDGRSWIFVENYISLIVPLLKAQTELENTLRVIARAEGLSTNNQSLLMAKIKEYIVAIKKPRFIIEEYRRQKGMPVFKNYAEQKKHYIQKEQKDFKEFLQQGQAGKAAPTQQGQAGKDAPPTQQGQIRYEDFEQQEKESFDNFNKKEKESFEKFQQQRGK